MLKGRLFIDDIDIYNEFGVYVVKDGWNELIAYPPLKSVTSNDWQEQDGIEVDLSEPILNTKEVQIKFAYEGIQSSFFFFLDMLSDGAYHTFNIASIKRQYKLRLVSAPSYKEIEFLGTATLKFADDFPLPDYEYIAPKSSIPTVEDYLLDEVPFTNYGARILKGTLDEIKKPSTVKTNLLRNIKTVKGAIYDPENVFYKAKDVKIYVLMRATTLDELWRNYDALLYDLVKPDERTLWVEEICQEFPCFYKSCQVTKFYPYDKIWLQFTLTLTLIREFRIDDSMVLAAENNYIILTEDNEYDIEMREDR